MKIVKVILLNRMPFDRYTDEEGFIHATGRELVFDDGWSIYEYENDPTADWDPEEDGIPVVWEDDEE